MTLTAAVRIPPLRVTLTPILVTCEESRFQTLVCIVKSGHIEILMVIEYLHRIQKMEKRLASQARKWKALIQILWHLLPSLPPASIKSITNICFDNLQQIKKLYRHFSFSLLTSIGYRGAWTLKRKDVKNIDMCPSKSQTF
jgi:uncharacterized protein YcbK (DUF882 family)